MELLAIIYCVLGYIAASKLLFKNTSVVGFGIEGFINGHFQLLLLKFFVGLFLGWILIPIWIIKSLLNR